jgi:hypothetical protein
MEKIEVEFRANFSRLTGGGGEGEGIPFICGATVKSSHFFGGVLGLLICLQYRIRIFKPYKEPRNRVLSS